MEGDQAPLGPRMSRTRRSRHPLGALFGRLLWTKDRRPAAGAGWRAAAAGGFAALVLTGLMAAAYTLDRGGGGPGAAGFLSEVSGSAGPGSARGSPPGGGSEAGSESAPALAQGGPSRWLAPVEGSVLEGYRWVYSDTFRDWRLHGGLDLASPAGAAVVAAAAGTVKSVDASRLWVHEVTLDLGGGWTAVYRGLGTVSVAAGERVAAGQTIGTVAEAVPAEEGEAAHVHWEARRDGRSVDPAGLLGP